ncbi:methyltransferase domain-containing protein [Patescibacteria group bacterium]
MNNKINKSIDELEKQAKKILNLKEATHGLKRALRNLDKEIKLFKNHKPLKRTAIDNAQVQIGGGSHYLEGFLNIDIQAPADIICDIREGIPLSTNSALLIFSEHFLEHVDYPVSAKNFIKESFRVLKRGGRLIIGVPDTARVLRAYIENDDKNLKEYIQRWYGKRGLHKHFNTAIDVVNYHMRDQDDSDKYAPHLWGYDRKKLESLLRTAGFKKIKEWRFDSRIANPKRKFGSIYVEGAK